MNVRTIILSSILAIIFIGASISFLLTFSNDSNPFRSQNTQTSNTFDLTLLEQGCPQRDCIPSLDDPQFETVTEADQYLEEDALIFGVSIDNQVRGYPQNILNWHEIVNDTINDTHFSMTFCPLCGSATVFEREIDGEINSFGVSGKLFNNNLVMYDRINDNYWQQETGVAISGKAADKNLVLKRLPIIVLRWSDWKDTYPNSEMLSRDTGYFRDYNRYPYGTYEEDDRLLFGNQNTDERLPLKEPGLGIEIDETTFVFYKESDLIKTQTHSIRDGLSIQVTTKNGQTTFKNTNTSEEYQPIRTFWFAFAAFHPNAIIFNP